MWQTQGFRPARSVLFAAWDGEEYGLKGSSYYVQNPVYPTPTGTVAVFSLDMTGVGDKLYVNGGEQWLLNFKPAPRSIAPPSHSTPRSAAATMLPFNTVGIPASVAAPYTDPDLTYHTTGDTVHTIQSGALRMAGALSAHALAAWSGGGPTLPAPPESRYLWDSIIPTPICHESRPLGSMTCDHGKWSRAIRCSPVNWAGSTWCVIPAFNFQNMDSRDPAPLGRSARRSCW